MKFPYKIVNRGNYDFIVNERDSLARLLNNANNLAQQRVERINAIELAAQERELEHTREVDSLKTQLEALEEQLSRREDHHLNYRAEERKRHRKQLATLKGMNTKLRNRLVSQ